LDNATHALAGLLLAQGVIVWRERRGQPLASEQRGALRWLSALANNLPDGDGLYARRLGGKLGYLLHHRGHSHTVLVAALLGVGLFGAWLLWRRFRGRAPEPALRWMALGLCLVGPFVHVALDSLNNYGTHVWWPFHARWYYGDTLFIIEPWLLVTLVPALTFELSSRWGRAFWWAVLGVALALAWGLEMVPPLLAVMLSAGAALSAVWCARVSSSARLAYGCVSVTLVLSAFTLGSALARQRVGAALTEGSTRAAEQLQDVVITPAPGNPLCFSVVSVSVASDRYITRTGAVSLLPGLVPTASCRIQRAGLTLGLSPARLAVSHGVVWEGEWRGSLSELRGLQRNHCHVAALLHFSRVPFWRHTGSSRLLLGDLRFDRDAELDFDELETPRVAQECPAWVPPWIPPRTDILQPQ